MAGENASARLSGSAPENTLGVAMDRKTKGPNGRHSAHAKGRKTVGVYDRPPQKRNLKPLLIVLFIALALVLTIIFVRFAQSAQLANRQSVIRLMSDDSFQHGACTAAGIELRVNIGLFG
jgi:hypothetical protein